MMLQLKPPIPVWTSMGTGHAILVMDYSQEHHLIWTIAMDNSGEIWSLPNPEVRLQRNITMGREIDKENNK